MTPFSQLSFGMRIFLMLLMLIVNYLLFPTAAVFILLPFTGLDRLVNLSQGNFTGDADRYIALFIQGVASLGAFGFTALLFSQMETGFALQRLKLNIKVPMKFLFLGIVCVLVAQAFIPLLVELNQVIPLPESLKYLKDSGKEQEKLINALLAGNSVIHFIVITLVLALIPAVAEEFFFRGLFMGELLKEKFHPAVAITISGFVFSLAHAEYENFLAIWVLGTFLGYLFYVSGSLWLSIAAHFTNNFLLVFLKYLYNMGALKADIEKVSIPLVAAAAAILIFAVCLYILNRWKTPPVFELISINESEQDQP
ncbi:MAG: family intrarane metalloprotease protein [Bacteroidota bacterium]|nr:family intrarane metalloprotease protein [Bacteroidota bacterium]